MSNNNEVYDYITTWRSKINEYKKSLNENEDITKEGNIVPYEKDDFLYKNMKEICEKGFDASFQDLNNPFLYYTEDGDITISGVIPNLNAQFQFRYKTAPNGINIWASPLNLNSDSVNLLNKINSIYNNWVDFLKNQENIKPQKLMQEN